MSCLRAEKVQVPPPCQTHSTQRPALDISESSHARGRDEDDDDDNELIDPTYEQDELMGSQHLNAPESTETQVHEAHLSLTPILELLFMISMFCVEFVPMLETR